ncbi:hypothetical protein [Herpetosiphon geysericola]|uniref:hypothetical protein n=1 Tax=Herpetosiphon geysericola TaxID=70996 RepID=UPI00128F3430|nr:hypothetical protein [Herpetosiphon geysericola]
MHRYSRLMLILGLGLLTACSNSTPTPIQPLQEQATASIPAASSEPTQPSPTQAAAAPAVAETAVVVTEPAPPSKADLAVFDDQQSPLSLLASFYNAVNRAEYQRAYSYFELEPMPFDQFEQGYEQTLSVDVLVNPNVEIDVGAGNQHARVAAALIAYDRQAGWQYFVGCYDLHRVNINGPSEPWQIRGSQFELVNDLQTLNQRVGQICPATSQPNEAQTPEQLLTLYTNALNQADYAQAFSYWREQPANDVAAWSQQFATKQFNQVLINPQGLSDAGAGNIYYSTNLVWFSPDKTGQLQFEVGCVTLHRNNTEPDQPWQIQGFALEAIEQSPAVINQALATSCQ